VNSESTRNIPIGGGPRIEATEISGSLNILLCLFQLLPAAFREARRGGPDAKRSQWGAARGVAWVGDGESSRPRFHRGKRGWQGEKRSNGKKIEQSEEKCSIEEETSVAGKKTYENGGGGGET